VNDRVDELLSQCKRLPGASPATITRVAEELGVPLPEDYTRVIAASNGVEGFVGENYLMVYPIEELPIYNAEGIYDAFASGVIVFGSNGGGEAFAVVTSANPPLYIAAPMGAWHKEDVISLGRSFEEFLMSVSVGYL
jgi:hypothetical protein